MRHAWLGAVVLVLLLGCDRKPGGTSGKPAKDPARPRFKASVITIAHADVHHYSSPKPRPTRTKAEAKVIADRIAAELKARPERFPDLARAESEDPFAADGGELLAWVKGENAELERPLVDATVGAVVGPLDTEYGWRLLRRETARPAARLEARHLLVSWKGSLRAPAHVVRTRAEALERARTLAAQARKAPATFERLIRAESDGWDVAGGGHLGQWEADGGRYPPAFDRAVLGLNFGEVSDPVETRFGYHLFLRLEARPRPEQLSAAHILIAFQGAREAPSGVSRTRGEAEALARKVAAEARAQKGRFADLARQHSDHAASAARGGFLGSWYEGQQDRTFEAAVKRLALEAVSAPVLTAYGWHVIHRRAAPLDASFLVR
jgi:parvulin-like peptidyl-prolyl isomerase